MKLRSVKYVEFEGTSREWSLTQTNFEPLSLLVGKNASGKTRTINIINALASMLNGTHKPDYASGDWSAEFEHNGAMLSYAVSIQSRKVVGESLRIDGNALLLRGPGGTGKIRAEKLGDSLDFQAPETQLAAFVRQDSIQHPFLNDLRVWADNVIFYPFGSSLGKNALGVFSPDYQNQINPKDPNHVVGIFRRAIEKHPKDFSNLLSADMQRLSYSLIDVGIDTPSAVEIVSPGPAPIVGIWAQERDLGCRTEQMQMSQGMFRALSLLGQLTYSYLEGIPSLVLIDDIGEGLDFERSSKLIELLVEKANTTNVQFILTTNDRFVMNSVPLSCWSIVERKGGRVSYVNSRNAKDSFDDFRFSGLNNFDFYSKNFYTVRDSESE